jgi:hypothetical protein
LFIFRVLDPAQTGLLLMLVVISGVWPVRKAYDQRHSMRAASLQITEMTLSKTDFDNPAI